MQSKLTQFHLFQNIVEKQGSATNSADFDNSQQPDRQMAGLKLACSSLGRIFKATLHVAVRHTEQFTLIK
jgi:hypothetical protein